MARQVTLHNRLTGEVEYPVTKAECVFDSNGNSIDALLTKHAVMSAAQFEALTTKDPNTFYFTYEE